MAHGTTWTQTVDGFIDEMNRRDIERQRALDALTRLCARRPELDEDIDVTQARMALLR